MTYDILKKPYEDYLKNHDREPFIALEEMGLSFDDFVKRIIKSYGFSKMWKVDVQKKHLDLKERLDIASNTYPNYDPCDFGIPANISDKILDELYPVPYTRITISYENETIEFYEPLNN